MLRPHRPEQGRTHGEFVAVTPAAVPAVALRPHETDYWDVYESLAAGAENFVLRDARGPRLSAF
jgi:hypothetical protein